MAINFILHQLEDANQMRIETATISLDEPTILRLGGCYGNEPEFAYTDFSKFIFIRILQ
jgi:hypothetical protein